MLKINNSICSIKSNTIKFGIYSTGTEQLPWYLKKDFEMEAPKGFPLIISVEFKDDIGKGYFNFCIEHISRNDFNELVNKSFEGIFNLNDDMFKLFKITFNNKFLDNNDVKTNIKVEFSDLKNEFNRIMKTI